MLCNWRVTFYSFTTNQVANGADAQLRNQISVGFKGKNWFISNNILILYNVLREFFFGFILEETNEIWMFVAGQ